MHPQFAALHPAGKVNFTLASQQRHGAHLPEVDPDRIVRVNGLFDRWLRMKEIRLVRRIGVEELRFLFEIDAQTLRAVC